MGNEREERERERERGCHYSCVGLLLLCKEEKRPIISTQFAAYRRNAAESPSPSSPLHVLVVAIGSHGFGAWMGSCCSCPCPCPDVRLRFGPCPNVRLWFDLVPASTLTRVVSVLELSAHISVCVRVSLLKACDRSLACSGIRAHILFSFSCPCFFVPFVFSCPSCVVLSYGMRHCSWSCYYLFVYLLTPCM